MTVEVPCPAHSPILGSMGLIQHIHPLLRQGPLKRSPLSYWQGLFLFEASASGMASWAWQIYECRLGP